VGLFVLNSLPECQLTNKNSFLNWHQKLKKTKNLITDEVPVLYEVPHRGI
jgi:hypothetical protein